MELVMDKELNVGDYIIKIYDNSFEKIKVFNKAERKQVSEEIKEFVLSKFKAKANLLGGEQAIKKLRDTRDIK